MLKLPRRYLMFFGSCEGDCHSNLYKFQKLQAKATSIRTSIVVKRHEAGPQQLPLQQLLLDGLRCLAPSKGPVKDATHNVFFSVDVKMVVKRTNETLKTQSKMHDPF